MKTLSLYLTVAVVAAPLLGSGLWTVALASPDPTGTARTDAYRSAQRALEDELWPEAIAGFASVATTEAGTPEAEAALYWKAWAEHRDARAVDALATLSQLRETYPASSWIDDARALEIEIRPRSAADLARAERDRARAENEQARAEADRVRAESGLARVESDRARAEGEAARVAGDTMGGARAEELALDEEDQLKLYALSSLMHADPERAVPVLERFLTEDHPRVLKERALFVLAQGGSDGGHEVVRRVATDPSDPDLQMRAVEYLGVFGGASGGDTLAGIYRSASDPGVKRKVLEAMMLGSDRDGLEDVAREETDPELRLKAIEMLAISGGASELRALWGRETDPAVRSKLLETTVITGDLEFLQQIFESESDPALQLEAVRLMGITGGEGASEPLSALYSRTASRDVKEAVIEAFLLGGDAQGLLRVLRSETDRELKRQALERLSLLDSDEAAAFFAEVLER